MVEGADMFMILGSDDGEDDPEKSGVGGVVLLTPKTKDLSFVEGSHGTKTNLLPVGLIVPVMVTLNGTREGDAVRRKDEVWVDKVLFVVVFSSLISRPIGVDFGVVGDVGAYGCGVTRLPDAGVEASSVVLVIRLKSDRNDVGGEVKGVGTVRLSEDLVHVAVHDLGRWSLAGENAAKDWDLADVSVEEEGELGNVGSIEDVVLFDLEKSRECGVERQYPVRGFGSHVERRPAVRGVLVDVASEEGAFLGPQPKTCSGDLE